MTTYARSIRNDPQSGYGNFLAPAGGGIVSKPYTLGPMFPGTTSAPTALASAKNMADHQISTAASY